RRRLDLVLGISHEGIIRYPVIRNKNRCTFGKGDIDVIGSGTATVIPVKVQRRRVVNGVYCNADGLSGGCTDAVTVVKVKIIRRGLAAAMDIDNVAAGQLGLRKAGDRRTGVACVGYVAVC